MCLDEMAERLAEILQNLSDSGGLSSAINVLEKMAKNQDSLSPDNQSELITHNATRVKYCDPPLIFVILYT